MQKKTFNKIHLLDDIDDDVELLLVTVVDVFLLRLLNAAVNVPGRRDILYLKDSQHTVGYTSK